jgi:succinoglycan biosynthesis protein ExoO
VRFFRAPKNGGPSAARNLALEQVRGRWIAIIDSDDLMSPRRLEHMISLAEEDHLDIVADNFVHFWDDRSAAPELHLDLSRPITFDSVDLIENANKCGYLKPVFRSERLGHIRYNEQLYLGEDLDYYLRALVTGAMLRVYPAPGYFYRKHRRLESSATQRKKVEGMLISSIAFRNEFAKSGRLSIACKNRENELRLIVNYLDLVDLVRNREFVKAVYFILKNPSTLRRLNASIRMRLKGSRERFQSKPTTPENASELQAEVDRILLETDGLRTRFLY